MHEFYQKWLTLWCWAVGLFGIVLAGGAFASTSGPLELVFAALGHPGEFDPDAVTRFAFALMGAVTFGWALTLYAAFIAANMLDGARAARVWKLILRAAFLWYILDSTLSIATGFAANAASNTLIMALLLVPVYKSGVLKG